MRMRGNAMFMDEAADVHPKVPLKLAVPGCRSDGAEVACGVSQWLACHDNNMYEEAWAISSNDLFLTRKEAEAEAVAGTDAGAACSGDMHRNLMPLHCGGDLQEAAGKGTDGAEGGWELQDMNPAYEAEGYESVVDNAVFT